MDQDVKDRWAGLYGVHDGWVEMLTDYNQMVSELPKGTDPKCTCGVSITMGSDDHIDFHSTWCDLKKKGSL